MTRSMEGSYSLVNVGFDWGKGAFFRSRPARGDVGLEARLVDDAALPGEVILALDARGDEFAGGGADVRGDVGANGGGRDHPRHGLRAVILGDVPLRDFAKMGHCFPAYIAPKIIIRHVISYSILRKRAKMSSGIWTTG